MDFPKSLCTRIYNSKQKKNIAIVVVYFNEIIIVAGNS